MDLSLDCSPRYKHTSGHVVTQIQCYKNGVLIIKLKIYVH